MKLDSKVVVITGGSGGIGLATARACRDEGAQIVVFGRNSATLTEAANELGEPTLAVSGDVTVRSDLDNLFRAASERFGRVDVVVANAGGINFTPLGQTGEDEFDNASDLNFKAVFFTVQAALPHLVDGGSVIVVGNALASVPVVGLSAALAAKAAAQSLARSFAVEPAPRGIRVNVVSPGPTSSVPTEQLSAEMAGVTKQIPLGRFGTPEDVARAALFLASEDASHITGADLHVGGGIGMGWVPQ